MPRSTAAEIGAELRSLANPKIAEHSQGFFKTAKGEYGEGDHFLGMRMPEVRKIARKYSLATLPAIRRLLRSRFHEERLLAAIMLRARFERSDAEEQECIYRMCLEHLRFINNWDIVDISAPQIVGGYLDDKDRSPLYEWARSENLWERRIAMMATLFFIRKMDFKDALAISEILLHDSHDLIHKAVGWMLREIGNRDRKTEEAFLKPRYREMPRTMLRYAIEKFPESRRQQWLRGKV